MSVHLLEQIQQIKLLLPYVLERKFEFDECPCYTLAINCDWTIYQVVSLPIGLDDGVFYRVVSFVPGQKTITSKEENVLETFININGLSGERVILDIIANSLKSGENS